MFALLKKHSFETFRILISTLYSMCVCFWPPDKGELLLNMRYQSLVLTSMMSPPYPRPQ